jgi:FSR family fosmidomycin resistance protein-like MFS transporter
VTRRTSGARPAWAGAAVLMAALAAEFVDELVDGTNGAALPLIRQGLGLTYVQVGLLASVPLLLGSLLELPMGILAGHGRRRRQVVLAGGAIFILTLVAAAAARTFAGLLIALVAFFPASGAFVGLSQSGLMDAAPDRQEQNMARWTVAGSLGSVTGPLLLVAVLAGGGSWRTAYLVLVGCATAAWLGAARGGPRQLAAPVVSSPDQPSRAAAARRAISVLRQREVVRWVVLLEAANLLGDVLTGFVALYFVDVLHATPAQAALGVAIRLGASLAGDAALLAVLEWASGMSVLRASAAAAAVLYPAFLLVPGIGFKLGVLAALSVATAPWYTVLQAQLYRSLPGESGIAVSLMSAAGLVSGIGPLAVGILAQRYGLAWALAALALAPACLLGGLRRPAPPAAPDL